MSVQRRSFFALRGAAPHLAQTPPVPSFSLCGGNVFTLSCTFYTEHPQDEGVFIQHSDLFSMGVENGAVYFASKILGRIQTIPQQMPLQANDWNNAAVVYDGSKLSLYLQGLPAAEKTVGAGERVVDNTDNYQMGLLEGYLLEVKLYSQALSETQVRKDQFVPQVEAEKTELFVDFDNYVPTDKGRHKLPLQLTGACETVNLVNGLHCDKDGGALPIGISPINPSTKELAAYTILVKAYATFVPVEGDCYLFANGALNQADTIALGLADGQTKPFFVIGAQRFLFSSTVTPGVWVDFAVTVTGQALTFYLNGMPSGTATLSAPFIRQAPAMLSFGNIHSANRFNNGFCGYLDSVAVFSAALPADRVLSYADIAPYGFDNDLAALWSFYDYEASEVKYGGAVSFTGGAKVALCENTVLDRVVPPLTFAIPDTPTGLNELEIWQANTAAKAFTLATNELTGMEPQSGYTSLGSLLGSLCCVVNDEFKNNQTIENITIQGKASASHVTDFLLYAASGAAIGLLCYGMYSAYKYRAYLRIGRLYAYLRVTAKTIAKAALSAYVGGSAGTLTYYIQEHKAPDTGKGGGAEYDISLVSLAFYNGDSVDAGALCARLEFNKPPVVPEWEHDVTPKAPALYYRSIAAGKTPVLRAIFTIKLKKSGSVTVKVGATAQDGTADALLLGALPEQSFTLTADGTRTIDFPLSANNLRQAALGARLVAWGWYYHTDVQHFLIRTEHIIHVIHAKPLSPWTTAWDSPCLPVYPLLELCVGITAGTDNETEPNKRFANQLVDWTHKGTRFTPRAWKDGARYARWDGKHKRLTVDIEKYTTALRGTAAVAVTALDIACLQLLLTRLEGLDQLRLLELESALGTAISIRSCKAMDTSVLSSVAISAYYTCGITAADDTCAIWDAFLTLKALDGADIKAKGISFAQYPIAQDSIGPPDKAQYQSLLCKEGSTCQIAMATQKLFVGALQLSNIQPGTPPNCLYADANRTNFDVRVKYALDTGASKARCHSISYKYIQECIIHLLNNFCCQNLTFNQCMDGLKKLLHAVTGVDACPLHSANTPLARGAWLALDDPNEACVKTAMETVCATKYQDFEEISITAECLLEALNSVLYNLRLGMDDWNSGIGKCFDCIDWVHVCVANDNSLHIDCQCGNPICDIPVDPQDLPAKELPGFYLTDDTDSKRMELLMELSMKPWNMPLSRIRGGVFANSATTNNPNNADSDQRRRFIYSSTNAWRHKNYRMSVQNIMDNEDVYFISGGIWTLYAE